MQLFGEAGVRYIHNVPIFIHKRTALFPIEKNILSPQIGILENSLREVSEYSSERLVQPQKTD